MRLEAKNISFAYHKHQPVLSNVSVAFESGERVALIGPSGCGKSTLAKLLGGYLPPQDGRVLFDEKPLPRDGFCPVQLIHQHPENVVNPRWKMHQTLFEGAEPDQTLIEELGIQNEWLDRWPNELSGGELQRFCVARALGGDVKFLLADEISTMLDVITQAQLWQAVLRVVSRKNMGLIVVTHNLSLAEKICTRTVRFHDLQTGI